jgi:hypothetical protein
MLIPIAAPATAPRVGFFVMKYPARAPAVPSATAPDRNGTNPVDQGLAAVGCPAAGACAKPTVTLGASFMGLL